MRRALVVVVGLALFGCGEHEDPLPELVPVSEFELLDQDGEEFNSRELRDKVWVVDLIFTSCPEICPLMSTTMANLHRRVDRPDVRFVSITVDPAGDTPEVLHAYAERYGADPGRWTFLTGSVEDVNRVVLRSFRLPLGDRMERDDGEYDILHTGRFLLIDRHSTMRGMYATDREGIEQIERDIARLLEEGS